MTVISSATTHTISLLKSFDMHSAYSYTVIKNMRASGDKGAADREVSAHSFSTTHFLSYTNNADSTTPQFLALGLGTY